MKSRKSLMRRLTLQSLERRCVLDGAGIEISPQELDDSIEADDAAWIASSSARGSNISGYRIAFDENGNPMTLPSEEQLEESLGVEAWNMAASGGAADVDLLAASSGEPSFNPDVDGSGQVTPLDVLMVINAINRRSAGESEFGESSVTSTASIALDIDGDNQVGPLDVLYIINELNRQTQHFSRWEELDSFMVGPPDFVDEAVGDEGGAMDWSTTLPALDFMDLEDPSLSSHMAGSMFVTATKSDGTSYLVSVDDTGKVTAEAKGDSAVVEVGNDSLIRINGEETGLGLGTLGSGYVLLPLSARITDFTIAWPWSFDEALASM